MRVRLTRVHALLFVILFLCLVCCLLLAKQSVLNYKALAINDLVLLSPVGEERAVESGVLMDGPHSSLLVVTVRTDTKSGFGVGFGVYCRGAL